MALLSRFLLFFVILAPVAAAQQTLRVPQDSATIQGAIDRASNGDTVLVSDGTYPEHIDFKGKAITVTSLNGPTKTIIDGGGTEHTVRFANSEKRNSILSGFTVRGGGGAVYPPAGVLTDHSAPTLTNLSLTGNVCNGLLSYSGAPLLQQSHVFDNGAQSCGQFAGAVSLSGTVDSNLGSLLPSVIGNTIENNTYSTQVIALVLYGGGVLLNNVFPSALIQSNIIRGNTQEAGGISISRSGDVRITQNLIYGNHAFYFDGTGIYISLGDGTKQSASIGPPLVYIANNTLYGNTATAPNSAGGSELFLSGDNGRITVVNNIFAGIQNVAAVECNPVSATVTLAPAVFDHNVFYNFTPGKPVVDGICVPSGYGNLVADPLFRDRASNDFHLTAGSPALDAGNNSAAFLSSTDFDGASRLQDVTGKPYPIVDMGAYEMPGRTGSAITTLTLTPSTYLVAGGGSPTLTATLKSPLGIPTGSVTFYNGATMLGALPLAADGTAVWQLRSLSPGTYDYLAVYAGQGSYAPAVSVKLYIVVNLYSADITLTSSLNPSLPRQAVTFTTTVSASDGAALKPIHVFDGTALLTDLTPDSAGKASYTTKDLAVGDHAMRASYDGDATHLSGEAKLTQTVSNGAGSDFEIDADATITVQTQHHTTFAVTVVSLGSFEGAVGLSCQSLPEHARCYFDESDAPIVKQAGTATVKVVLETSDVRGYRSSNPNPLPALSLASLIALFLQRRQKGLRSALFRIIFFGGIPLFSVLLGCSGKLPASTTPGSYTFQVTGAAQGKIHSADIQLTVTK